jgi:hypothetical protein
LTIKEESMISRYRKGQKIAEKQLVGAGMRQAEKGE